MILFYNIFGAINSIVAVVLYIYAIITGNDDAFIAGVAFAGLGLAQWNAAEIREGQR